MLESFKYWINSLLTIGIFISILELILPKSKMKKYIYVLVGIITTITIISPIINLLNHDNIAESITTMLNKFSNDTDINSNMDLKGYQINKENIIKEEFINKFKQDIEFKLNLSGVNVEDIYINVTENYSVEFLKVKIKKTDEYGLKQINKIIEYINKEYDIPYQKIEIIESGG